MSELYRNGWVTIAGHRVPIDDVQLMNGGVTVTYTLRGPRPRWHGPVSVFGKDGKGCWQGRTVDMPEQPLTGSSWVCHYTLRLTSIDGANEGDPISLEFT